MTERPPIQNRTNTTSLPTRREMLRTGAGTLAGLSLRQLLPAAAAAQNPKPENRPNILLIITDQQHAGMMSCAGNKWLKTPAMDRLAARGVRFERAYCGNPVCVPSRFSMMTGVLPSRIGMDRNKPGSYPVDPPIFDHALGHVFRNAGYKTVYGGKVHLPGTGEKGIAAYGFETLTSDQRQGLADSCVQFFRRHHHRPFLLVASFINPHDICYMAIDAYTRANNRDRMFPRSTRERRCLAEALEIPDGVSRDEFFDKLCPPLPDNFEIPENEAPGVTETDWRQFRHYVRQNWSPEEWRMHRWAYARLTELVDSHIDKVLTGLEKSGLAENTVVVFTSDHGDMDAAHRLEHKSMPYEEAACVPLIVAGPGVPEKSRIDRDNLVSTGLDLIPTLCDFASIPKPDPLPGRSIKPLLTGDTEPDWRKTLVFENEGSRVLVSDRYKYAVYAQGQPREMLFDLEKDPGEMKNLALDPEHRKTLARHRRLLKKWYTQNNHTLPSEYIVT